MASVRKYRNGYRAEIRRQGHAPVSKTFQKKSDAREWATMTEAALLEGTG